MGRSFDDLLALKLSRRACLRGAFAAASMLSVPAFASQGKRAVAAFGFTEVARHQDETHHLPSGYRGQILLRWGEPVLEDTPPFDPLQQSAGSQAKQAGYNHDFIAYFSIAGSSRHGLLCINHEYADAFSMREGGTLAENAALEMQAVGCSIIEVKQTSDDRWHIRRGVYNRRITATTPMRLSGAAAGHPRLQTQADPTGSNVLGTFANCAGGQTPWGTYLTCEENIDGFFYPDGYQGKEADNHQRMGFGSRQFHRWDVQDERFNIAKHPHEPNRFGWVVEINPFAPDNLPVKRTALGRFKHESATVTQDADGRIVVYSGDDEMFQHFYKYVSRDAYLPDKPNPDILDEGILYVARFDADGVDWLPLIYGSAPLDATHGFNCQADVLIDTRRAAQLLGATPLDRPEDVAVNERTGAVYVALTKNKERQQTDAVNHRAPNPCGVIVRLQPPIENDKPQHSAARFGWEIALAGGQEEAAEAHLRGLYGQGVTPDGLLACPDNLAVDARGNLWIATDGQSAVLDCADSLYATSIDAAGKLTPKAFFRAPIGAEVTGPCFTPDGRSLFLSVQHPAEGSPLYSPSTRWPDFDPAMPPRPAVVVITKKDGGFIGD